MKNYLFSLFACIALSPVSAQVVRSDMQFFRPNDKTGTTVFETGKSDTVVFENLSVRIGGNFTQQFQAIEHENDPLPDMNAAGINLNELMDIGPGFNLATANLNIDVQLADGIRLNLVTYLSSRHHQETWVKGGYLQFDKFPFFGEKFNGWFAEHITVKTGHMEINYGDAHFRRTDNGNAIYNPFVGNYILDAFTTEIAGEIYYRTNSFFVMGAASNGEIKGEITQSSRRKPSLYAKAGFDKQLTEDLRVRLTGSVYTTEKSLSNTLYAGDRAGSRYYLVMENKLATASANFTSARLNPGFRSAVTAFMINPFIKFGGIEVFGTYEQAAGNSSIESEERKATQSAAELIYRFGADEKFYVGGRYNKVEAELQGLTDKISIERIQAGAGWFLTKNILAKIEYADQSYYGYPENHILHKGRFKGIILEGIVAF